MKRKESNILKIPKDKEMYQKVRSKNERRSGIERRKIYDLDYFSAGGVERRSYRKRHEQDQERASKTTNKEMIDEGEEDQ